MRKIVIYPLVYIIISVFAYEIRAQSVRFKSPIAKLNISKESKVKAYSANLGTEITDLYGMHGITYRLSFNSEAIYANSLSILADKEMLGLAEDEYYEMYRIDSSSVLYSLSLKGRDNTLNLDNLPIDVNFVIKPETHYQLIANNCEYTIEFKAESIIAYDNNKTEIELSPFVLPIELECEKKGDLKLLLAAPNPTKERCWIHLPSERSQDIEMLVLLNAAGNQQNFSSQIKEDEIELNLDLLLAGHYYLNIIYKNHNKDVVKIAKL